MPITISPTVPNININGNTYDHADWENNTPGTISGIANDISSRLALIETVGILTKAISGSLTLTGPESTNIGFVFIGTLASNANINFAAGFEGIAQIENQTAGGFDISCGLESGTRVSVPNMGSAAAFCDGSNFSLASGVVRTSSGAKVIGSLVATSDVQVAGPMTVTGAAVFSNTLSSVGNMSTDGDMVIDGNLTVFGTGNFSGAIAFLGDFIADGSGNDFNLIMTTTSGNAIWLKFTTNGLGRWLVGKDDTLESGANLGSDYQIIRYNDAGTPVAIPFKIKRSNGNIILEELPISSAGLAVGTVWNDSGTLKIV